MKGDCFQKRSQGLCNGQPWKPHDLVYFFENINFIWSSLTARRGQSLRARRKCDFFDLSQNLKTNTGYLFKVRLLFTSKSCLSCVWFHSCITKKMIRYTCGHYHRVCIDWSWPIRLRMQHVSALYDQPFIEWIFEKETKQTNKCLESCLDVHMAAYFRCTVRWSERESEIMMLRLNFRLFCFEKVANFEFTCS